MDAVTASYFLLEYFCLFLVKIMHPQLHKIHAYPAKNTASAEAVKYGSFKPEALRSAVKKGMIFV